ADASIAVDRERDHTLTLIYLPHLDYAMQKFGPETPEAAAALREVDAEVGRLLDHFRGRGARVIVLSEYGIEPVDRPVHLNRVLRQAGMLVFRDELDREYLDAGASAAFAVADHQVAHVYINDPSRRAAVRELIEATPG